MLQSQVTTIEAVTSCALVNKVGGKISSQGPGITLRHTEYVGMRMSELVS